MSLVTDAPLSEQQLQSEPSSAATLRKVLARADLNGLMAGEVVLGERLFGRNISYRVDAGGRSWFAKILSFDDAATKIDHCLAYDRLQRDHAGLPHSPRCVIADRDTGLLVQPWLEGATTGNQLMVDQTFGPGLARDIGVSIARLHSLPVYGVPHVDQRPAPAPSPHLLEGLPASVLTRLTGGELSAYGLLQRDSALVTALNDLYARSLAAPRAAIHGDLRVDQVLVHQDQAWVIDWEEFGTGDPARDTGTFLGEWLYRAVLDAPTSRGGGEPMRPGDREFSARATAKLRRLAPILEAFWDGYVTVLSPGQELRRRTAGFAGWHLLDRLVAGAATSATLPAIHRAAAGIGRAIVLNPEKAYSLLRMTVTHAAPLLGPYAEKAQADENQEGDLR